MGFIGSFGKIFFWLFLFSTFNTHMNSHTTFTYFWFCLFFELYYFQTRIVWFLFLYSCVDLTSDFESPLPVMGEVLLTHSSKIFFEPCIIGRFLEKHRLGK